MMIFTAWRPQLLVTSQPHNKCWVENECYIIAGWLVTYIEPFSLAALVASRGRAAGQPAVGGGWIWRAQGLGRLCCSTRCTCTLAVALRQARSAVAPAVLAPGCGVLADRELCALVCLYCADRLALCGGCYQD
jgi:hypothetical protein